jgi:hypothetical protein
LFFLLGAYEQEHTLAFKEIVTANSLKSIEYVASPPLLETNVKELALDPADDNPLDKVALGEEEHDHAG